jgi:hypothetical protein
MTDAQKIEAICELIQASELDDTIKNILMRDLQTEGLTEFSREQIKAYCLDTIKNATEQIEMAKKALDGTDEDSLPKAA